MQMRTANFKDGDLRISPMDTHHSSTTRVAVDIEGEAEVKALVDVEDRHTRQQHPWVKPLSSSLELLICGFDLATCIDLISLSWRFHHLHAHESL